MKSIYYIILLFSILSCDKATISKEQTTIEPKNIHSYTEQKVDSIHTELNSRVIEPDYIVLVDNDTVLFDDFKLNLF